MIIKKYILYKIEELEVRVPKTDQQYSRFGDSTTETINTLVFIEEFDSLIETEQHLINSEYSFGNYTILPIYKKNEEQKRNRELSDFRIIKYDF